MSAVIVAAKRSAVGSFGGSLSQLSASEIGTQLLTQILADIAIDPTQIDEVILGQVLTAGCGQNPARQTAINAGIPATTAAMTINILCGSGLKTVAMAAQAIENGDADIIVAGGQESMSQAPHLLPKSRDGQRLGDWKLVDSMLNDGLLDAFHDYHMGITAENLRDAFPAQDLARNAQDEYAAKSQQKATAAINAGWFDEEILPISIPQRRADPIEFKQDEGVRNGTSADSLAKLRPAFKKDGTVTAGNASTLNDGASMVIVMSEEKAKSLDLPILARIRSHATRGVDPSIMGSGPIPATKAALSKAGWTVDDLDLIEANEAFAVQAMCVANDLAFPEEKLNIGGGAIAIGHPIGASGCRILVSLLHHMARNDSKKGLATLCVGGGMGVALTIERD
jgi:acetyl-CoA C-acetyltransferase